MALSISIYSIDINHHSIKEYILLEIYLLEKRKGRDIYTKIIRKAYLIDSLKVKILLDINVIRPKRINIITSRSEVYIRFYNTIVAINYKLRSRDITIKPIIADK